MYYTCEDTNAFAQSSCEKKWEFVILFALWHISVFVARYNVDKMISVKSGKRKNNFRKRDIMISKSGEAIACYNFFSFFAERSVMRSLANLGIS